MVDRPLDLSYADLRVPPQTDRDARLPVRHRLAGARRRPGTGVKLADLLDEAGVAPAPPTCAFCASTASTPRRLTLEQARRDDVLVAHQMLGEPGHPRARRPGAPLRRPDVRLQVAQVARAHRGRHGSTSLRSRATGRTSATTSTPGSARSNGRDDEPTRDRAPSTPATATSRSSAFARAERWRCTGPTPRCSHVLLVTGHDPLRRPAHRPWSAGGCW